MKACTMLCGGVVGEGEHVATLVVVLLQCPRPVRAARETHAKMQKVNSVNAGMRQSVPSVQNNEVCRFPAKLPYEGG